MTNFPNGALVLRVWKFDGSGEVISKHQWMSDAEAFARMKAADDAEKRPGDAKRWFYIAACECECSVRAFDPIPKASEEA